MRGRDFCVAPFFVTRVRARDAHGLIASSPACSAAAEQLSLKSIVAHKTPIDHIGELLPNLLKLRLVQSTVPSFRDMGTKLRNLRVLWMSRCGVNDLSGISGLPKLEELYLSFNDVRYLEDLSMHDNIQVLDLEANQVQDFDQLDHLGSCQKLNCLTLSGCPLSTSIGGISESDYRVKVLEKIPGLECLDDAEVFSEGDENGGEGGKKDDMFFRCAVEPADGVPTKISWRERAAEESKFIDEAVKHSNSNLDSSVALSYASQVPARPSTAHEADSRRSKSLLELLKLTNFDEKVAQSKSNNASSSSLTHGTNVVFAGGAARGLRKFNSGAAGGIGRGSIDNSGSSDNTGSTTTVTSVGGGLEPRATADDGATIPLEMLCGSTACRGGVTEYEVAGNADDFKSAIDELKSWRVARARGGWCPTKAEQAGGSRDAGGGCCLRFARLPEAAATAAEEEAGRGRPPPSRRIRERH